MLLIYIIGAAVAMAAGFWLGWQSASDRLREQYRASKPAEIYSAVKDVDVPIQAVRGRGW